MTILRFRCFLLGLPWLLLTVAAQGQPLRPNSGPTVLAVGETFTLTSKALGETRRINVYLPPGYAEAGAAGLPVL